MSPTSDPAMLEVNDLCVDFDTPAGTLRAVDGVSVTLARGEALGVVGESGSGKSVFARTLVGLMAANGTRTGTIKIGGRNLDSLDRRQRRHFFGVEVAMIFQDPMTSLNPVKRIDAQLTESMRFHLGMSKDAARAKALELLDQVQIPSPDRRLRQYPHELSGGMRQRIVIAMALACEPKLLIADEPTTALDVTVQKAILDLLDDLRRDRDMSLILITHDLGVARGRTDRVSVMYAGQTMEHADSTELFAATRHPYTEALLRSIPRHDQPSHTRLAPIPGRPPDLLNPPSGCRYAPRCGYAVPTCVADAPQVTVAGEHRWSCHQPIGSAAAAQARAANEDSGVTATGLPTELALGTGGRVGDEANDEEQD